MIPVSAHQQRRDLACPETRVAAPPARRTIAKEGFKTPEQGRSTTLWAATSEVLLGKTGVYCEDCDIAASTDLDIPTARYVGVDPHTCDEDEAERLWHVSEQLL